MTEFASKKLTRRGFLTGVAAAAGMTAAGFAVLPAFADDETEPEATEPEPAEEGPATPKIHRAYHAAHGEACFAQVVVATDADGVIIAANVDEYQFLEADLEGLVPVPVMDETFGTNVVEGRALASKKQNDEPYTKMIGIATQSWATSMKAIEDFCVGKTAEELADVDAVSGATLEDTANYVAAIAATSLDDEFAVAFDGEDIEGALIGSTLGCAHSGSALTTAQSLVLDGVILAASIDEFQFLDDDTEGIVPVPNSDGKFGSFIVEGKALCSKSQNSPAYSLKFIEGAGGTQEWLTSMEAIEEAIQGTEVVEDAFEEVDAVSGATLTDSVNYMRVALEAAMTLEEAEEE